jgi:hypothetical protein
MTKSFNVDLNTDDPTPIVTNGFYPQPNPNDNDYKLPHRPQEVLIVNTSENTVYLGDAGAFYDNTGIPVYPAGGIALSLGSGDELFGWADGTISVPVMILDGKGR